MTCDVDEPSRSGSGRVHDLSSSSAGSAMATRPNRLGGWLRAGRRASRRLLAAEHEPVGRINPELRGIRSSRSRHGRDRPLAALALLHEPILSVATKTGKNVECRCGGGRRETERVRLLVRKSRPMAPSFTSFYIVMSHWWYSVIAVVGGSGS